VVLHDQQERGVGNAVAHGIDGSPRGDHDVDHSGHCVERDEGDLHRVY
jgi:hypothetical protein